ASHGTSAATPDISTLSLHDALPIYRLIAAIQQLQGGLRSQSGVHCRDGNGDVQVIALADKHRVILGLDLDVEVTGRAAARADLALTGHADAHTAGNTDRNLHRDVPASSYPAIALAVLARILNHLAGAATAVARAGDLHAAQDGVLNLHDLALPVTGGATHRLGLGLGPRPLAGLTQHCGVHGDLVL